MKKARLICISLLFISLGGLIPTGFGAASASDPLDNWTIIDNGTNKDLNGVAYGNGTFVAVGGNKVEDPKDTPYGIILTSPDGVTWTDTTPQNIVPLFKITYGNGTFVAAGGIVDAVGNISNSKILTSPDGITWTDRTPSGLQGLINAIAYDNGIFVAADVHFSLTTLTKWSSSSPDGHSILYTSSDGINWQKRTSTLGAIINAIAYGNGVWIAMGAHYDESLGKEDCKIFFSSDNGQHWRATTGQYVVLHNKLSSPGPTGDELLYGKQLTFGNGVFWGIPQDQIGGNGTLINSNNGINWNKMTLTTSLATYNRFNSTVYGNGSFIVVGEEGILVTSAFGETWTARISGTINELRDIVFGKDTFVAVGYGGIIIQSGPVAIAPSPPSIVSKRGRESNAWNFSGGLAAVKVGDKKWCFINKAGRMVLNPIFDDTLGFSWGWAAVNIGGQVSFINKNGKTLEGSQSEDAKSFSGGAAAVKVSGVWGFINTNGKLFIAPRFDDAWSFSGGLAAVKVGNKIGFINGYGRMIINPVFDDALDFSDKLAAVLFEGKWGFVDKRGMLFEPIFDDALSFSEGFAPVALNGKWGFVNDHIVMVIEPKFDIAFRFSEGFAGVKTGDKWGFINYAGEMVITPQFDDIQSFSEDFAAVKLGGEWGFIDGSGIIVIGPQYEDTLGFSQGLAAVKVDGKVGFINKKGQMLIKPQFDLSGSF